MIEYGDGSFQRAIDNNQCPRCMTAVDYNAGVATCFVCNLKISGEGIQKQRDPNQLELPFDKNSGE